MELMIIAGTVFLLTHLGISSTSLRGSLVSALGEAGYLLAYSIVAALSLAAMIWVYGLVPRYEYFWLPDPWFNEATRYVMPLATILLAGSFLVKNPGSVGMERALDDPRLEEPARGLLRITRHPMQWSIVLWSAAHVAANGDKVSVVFFGTFLVLGLAGGALIDRKRSTRLGPAWGRYAAVTSNIPFVAILRGRNRLVVRELLLPAAVGIVVYFGLLALHPWIAGVPVP